MAIQYNNLGIYAINHVDSDGVVHDVARVSRNGSVVWEKQQPVAYEGLKFTANEAGSTIRIRVNGSTYSLNISLFTSRDGIRWKKYSIYSGDVITLPNVGDYVYFKAGPNGNGPFGKPYFDAFHYFDITGSVAASGNIQSLFDEEMKQTSVPAYGLINLFYQCSKLTSAPFLPATTLSTYCYGSMFYGCSGLLEAPELGARNLAESCYNNMFAFCTGLTEAPYLPARVLAPFCYAGMFYGTGLTKVPTLPATTLANYCYYSMFKNCSSLKIHESGRADTVILNVPSGTSAPTSWGLDMFLGTSGSFTSDPVIGSAYYCYQSEPVYLLTFTANTAGSTITFKYRYGTDVQYRLNDGEWVDNPSGTTVTLTNVGHRVQYRGTNVVTGYNAHFEMTGSISGDGSVTSLTDRFGSDPDVVMESQACYMMFEGCTALRTAPAVLAREISYYGCTRMFYGCTGLVSAKDFIATYSDFMGLSNMFYGCTNLLKAPMLPLTSLSPGCCHGMFADCENMVKAMPELQAETLTDSCYMHMFNGCASLLKTPFLNAVTQVRDCYYQMFYGCSSLSDITTRQGSFAGSTRWIPENVGVFHCTQQLKTYIDTLSTRSTSNVPNTWKIVNDQV